MTGKDYSSIQINSRSIQNKQQNLPDALKRLDPLPRFLVGLLGVTLLAYFLPRLLYVLLTGKFGILFDGIEASIIIPVMLLQNLLGNKLRKIMSCAVVFFLLWAVALTTLDVLTRPLRYLLSGLLPVLLYFLVTTLLNGWLLLRYKQAADLQD